MSEDFSESMQDIVKLRRARQLALAIIRRSEDAGIPSKYSRIDKQTFSSLLSPEFHGNTKGVESFSQSVYKDQEFLVTRDFIIIDGGNFNSRQMAGFALLFRMIAYDKTGKYVDTDSLRHKFQTLHSTENLYRNDLAEDLKDQEVLFMGEFDGKKNDVHFEIGSFFDEVLTDRINSSSPTIISFVSPISTEKMTEAQKEIAAMNGKLDAGCGKHMARLANASETNSRILRVRVKAV